MASKMKKAFTLVEIIISVILLGIVVTFIYQGLQNTQKSNQIFKQKERELNLQKKISKVLYEDIFMADEIRITGGKKYKSLELTTNNSLFNIIKPKVIWLVSKHNDTLVRVESTKLPLTYENRFISHLSKVAENCEIFSIYQSRKKDKILFYIKFKDQKPIVYEFFKPFKQKIIKPKKPSNNQNKDKNSSNPKAPEN